MAKNTDGRLFGKRAQQHVLILASGDKIRHVTIRPWIATGCVGFVTIMVVGYLAATCYLFLRDDLIGATMARQARIQHDYEDRIAALRSQLDRVTSRQLLDQQLVEQKVERLLEQQDALFDRHGKIGSILKRAEQSGLAPQETREASARATDERRASLSGGSAPSARTPGIGYVALRESTADSADRIFSKVTRSLKSIEKEQLAKIANLTIGASSTADAITAILERTGVEISATPARPANASEGVGGPYVEPERSTSVFEASLGELDTALDRLESARETARDLPFGNPAPGHQITSRYGNRIDPFLGRLALHAGIDFEAATGEDVKATGSGKVITAGISGGYGNMVEIDHGQGITTRYGHLSKILVEEGTAVSKGDVIGHAGSTGRSTGAHIHYEVRRYGNPVDPAHFLDAGLKLTTYLD